MTRAALSMLLQGRFGTLIIVLGCVILGALAALLLTLFLGAFYENFIRRRPRIELARDHRRRIHWLLAELTKELEDKKEDSK